MGDTSCGGVRRCGHALERDVTDEAGCADAWVRTRRSRAHVGARDVPHFIARRFALTKLGSLSLPSPLTASATPLNGDDQASRARCSATRPSVTEHPNSSGIGAVVNDVQRRRPPRAHSPDSEHHAARQAHRSSRRPCGVARDNLAPTPFEVPAQLAHTNPRVRRGPPALTPTSAHATSG